MKKLFKSLILVILIGVTTSIIDRFTGMHSYEACKYAVIMYSIYLISIECGNKKLQAK